MDSVDLNWKMCCRGSGNCPEVSVTSIKEIITVFIKDDAGDSVRLTLDQLDSINIQVASIIPHYFSK